MIIDQFENLILEGAPGATIIPATIPPSPAPSVQGGALNISSSDNIVVKGLRIVPPSGGIAVNIVTSHRVELWDNILEGHSEASNSGALYLNGNECRVKNSWDVFAFLSSSSAQIEDCLLEGDLDVGVGLMVRQGSLVTVYDSTIRGTGCAVEASRGGSVTLNDTTIEDFKTQGLQAGNGGVVVFRGGRVSSDVDVAFNWGAQVAPEGFLQVTAGAEITNTRGHGVGISHGSAVIDGSARIIGTHFHGVSVSDGGSLTLGQCTITGNTRAGIYARRFATVTAQATVDVTGNGDSFDVNADEFSIVSGTSNMPDARINAPNQTANP